MNPVRSKIFNQSADSQSANRTSNGMKTIAVDVDDVLALAAKDFIAFTNARWGTTLTVDDFDEHWAKVWQVDHAEELKRKDEYISSGTIKNYDHFPDAVEVLNKLKKNYKLVVLTSRIKILNKDTRDWIDKYFTDIFSEIHFSGIWDDPNKLSSEKIHYTKAEVFNKICADYLIDDQLKHCIAVAEAGMPALLFGDYKWNQIEGPLPKNITRAKDWLEVLTYFDE